MIDTTLRFPVKVIKLPVRWYVRYRLSYADTVEWLTKWGVEVDRTTVYRWVRRFLPLLHESIMYAQGRVHRGIRMPAGRRSLGGRQ